MNGSLTPLRHFVACLALVLGVSAAARAQAVDSFDPGANHRVFAIAVQPNGDILVGGQFTALGGGTGTTPRSRIGRLHADGSIDTSFDPGANDWVHALVVQADGKILVGGNFTGLGGGGTGVATRNFLGRLNADGSLDTSFNPGANSNVFALALQPDGKILVGGAFTTLGGGGTGTTIRNHIGRLHPDGSLDTSFDPGPGGSSASAVYTLGLQSDGRIVVGGSFTTWGGTCPPQGCPLVHLRLARVNGDGSLDQSFRADAYRFPAPHSLAVWGVVVQPDSKILVTGEFTYVGYEPLVGERKGIARLNGNGSVEHGFDPGADGTTGFNLAVSFNGLALQADGKIFVGGSFVRLGNGAAGPETRNIGRLLADGSQDTSFNPGVAGGIYAIAVQPDGGILVAGQFTALGGGTGTTPRSNIGRFSNGDAAVQRLGVIDSGRTVTWERGGSSPEVSWVTFEVSSDGLTYVPVGQGTRTATGWQLTGQSLPPEESVYIRARASYPSGYGSRSGSFAESVAHLPGSFAKVAPVDGAASQLTNLTFSWTASAGATGYGYCYDTTDDNMCATWTPVGLVLSVVPTGVQAGTHYYWQVRATGTTDAFTEADEGAYRTFETAAFGITPRALFFGGSKAGASGALQYLTPPQSVTLTVLGAPIDGSVTADQTWVHVTAGPAGTGRFTIEVVNPDNVIGGSSFLTASVVIHTGIGAVTIPITFVVDQSGRSTVAAFGQVDTPIQNSIGVQGTIGVSGWALDDIGVRDVKVYRNFVGSDSAAASQILNGHHVVYIGDAVLFSGARPDVAVAFPDAPQNHRAGWGFQVLTNMLPHLPAGQAHGGQGGFSLYVFATDLEGHLTLLGRDRFDHTPTVMAVDNDHIAKPFGTIDTPGPGTVVSGVLSNFGWALTPDTDTIAGNNDVTLSATSPQMFVFVDGEAVGVVQFNQCRGTVGSPPAAGRYCDDDVANAFGNVSPLPPLTERTANPTRFRNLDAGLGAIGYFLLNTAALVNGPHAIAWSVTDSAGRTEGVGSRLFEVANIAPAAAQLRRPYWPVPRFSATPRVVRAARQVEVVEAPDGSVLLRRERAFDSAGDDPAATAPPIVSFAVTYRTGYSLAAPFVPLELIAGGIPLVRIPELGRVEIDLGGAIDRGYAEGPDGPQSLPTGASLDVARGRFTWTPLSAYLGTFRFVFLRGDERITVDVRIDVRTAGT